MAEYVADFSRGGEIGQVRDRDLDTAMWRASRLDEQGAAISSIRDGHGRTAATVEQIRKFGGAGGEGR